MSDIKKSGNLNRRDFFRSGGALAAGAAAIAAIGAPAIVRGQNLNSKLNFGVIGTGSRAGSILRAVRGDEYFNVTDLCDVFPPHLEECKTYIDNPDPRTTAAWEEVIARDDVDCIIVSTPLFLHVPMSIAALNAGKHVYSEKSMGLSMKQLNDMEAAVAAHPDLVYLVGYQSHLSNAIGEARRLIEAGSIGKVTQFSVHFDRNQSWKKEVPDPKWERILNWRLYREYCGGVITEVITHPLDMVLDILNVMPVRCSSYGNILVYKDERECHDHEMIIWEMDSGILGFGSGHFSNTFRGVGWKIFGTHGTMVYSGGELKIYWETAARHLDAFGIKHQFTKVELGQSIEDEHSSSTTKPKVFTDEIDKDYGTITARAIRHFADCVQNGTAPIMNAATAKKSSMSALLALESSYDGGKQKHMDEIIAQG